MLRTLALALAFLSLSAAPTTPPVVLELFTSQGCSSCPPADALLRKLSTDPRVIPLSFHVDYWNHLGWKDPFSSREWSQRQGEYVRAMKLGSAYTPQLVVNGARQVVGSSAAAVYKAIEEESRRRPEGTVALRRTPDGVKVEAKTARKDVELVIVTYDDGATTKVKRGENGGKTLANVAIVRSLIRPGTLAAHLPIESKRGVMAFLQERGTKRIVSAGRLQPVRLY
jgi:hypothetical protein